MESVEIRGVLVPREGFLRRKEMEALFNREIQAIMRWVKKGLLPEPLNYSEQFKGLVGESTAKFWDAPSVWAAYDRLRGYKPNEGEISE